MANINKKEIRLAIAGVGNCASSLIQGLYYYKNIGEKDKLTPGLMHNIVGPYKISDIKVVAAFDIDERKVGKDISEAIWAKPNNTYIITKNVSKMNVKVKMGPVLDGISPVMKDYPKEDRFSPAKLKPVDVVKELQKSKADMLINYMPVGSDKATQFYAKAALDAGIGFINCVPSFIVSESSWQKKFEQKNIPIIGDDIKAQIGATITHRALAHLFNQRGVKLDRTYQLNFGGNTDFLNMLERSRLKSKKISKTEAVQSQLETPLDQKNIHIGPSDYIPWLEDQKICYIRMEGRKFGEAPVIIDLKLQVEDSPNSAGCTIDAIRILKLALDRKIGGPIYSASAYFMKHPPKQFTDDEAKQMVEEFIQGKRER
ncbi:MAG: inositol-3-phosphate synthase [Candidatus Pacebacteria bacterium]|nr:inositol-3-phosphate synthase [Candidatus Paceibacterota bacterium]